MGGTSPQVIETTVALREAIASRSACARAARTDPVDRDLQRKRDLARLDSLYVQAVAWSDGDVRLALVALAVATLPYRTFPATIPLTGWVMTVPVSDESVNAFEARLRALPSELFADTPAGGDRDKLPHFFGSAWLALTFGCDPLASAMGILVEQLESWFKLEGSSDARDLETDELGIAFARRLRDDVRVLPSTLFRFKTSLTTDIPGSVQLR